MKPCRPALWLVVLAAAGCVAAPIPPPPATEMAPGRLAAGVRIPLSVHVAEVELASAAREVETPFESVAGAFPFTKAAALVDLRNAVRMTLGAAGASTEPQAPGARYVLTPIVLGGMTIPFREAYAFLFMRYEHAGADGAKVWSINVYSQAKLDTHDTDAWRRPEVQTAYARLAAANLRQMAGALSGWTTNATR